MDVELSFVLIGTTHTGNIGAAARAMKTMGYTSLRTRLASNQTTVRVALVFGRERSGLNNHELDRCTHLVQIPVNPGFSSLNLGSAVQVLAYECSTGMHDVRETTDQVKIAATSDSAAMERLFEHLERVLLKSGFLDPANPKQLMRRFRHYFERNRPDDVEMNVWRGLLTSVERPISSDKEKRSGPEAGG